jgi:hypothetical protein
MKGLICVNTKTAVPILPFRTNTFCKNGKAVAAISRCAPPFALVAGAADFACYATIVLHRLKQMISKIPLH